MAGEWREATLGELGEVDRGRSRHRPRNAPKLYGGPYPFVQTGDIKASQGRVTAHTQTYSDAGLAQSRLWPAGTMVITIAANIAETAILTYPACFPDSVVGFVGDESKCDVRFIEYTFRLLRNEIQHENVGTGSVQDNINLQTLDRLRFKVPPLPEQRAIAHVLGTLDDKIELNRRMNETLEEMARALFKSWFVDFDPVRAKMEGRWRPGESLPGLPAHLYDLFPDHLVDSELGPIPEGWEVRRLGDCLTTLESGNRPKGGVSGIAEGIPSVGAESIERVGAFDFSKTKYVSRKFYASMKRGVVQDGDVLIYKDGGRPGELLPAVTYASHNFPFDEFCINEHVFRVRASRFSQQLLYCYLTTQEAFWQMRELATGAAQPGLNRGAVESIPVKMPSDTRLLKACEEQIGSLLDRCNVNALKSHALSQTRDTLLPRLVSGEVRV